MVYPFGKGGGARDAKKCWQTLPWNIDQECSSSQRLRGRKYKLMVSDKTLNYLSQRYRVNNPKNRIVFILTNFICLVFLKFGNNASLPPNQRPVTFAYLTSSQTISYILIDFFFYYSVYMYTHFQRIPSVLRGFLVHVISLNCVCV